MENIRLVVREAVAISILAIRLGLDPTKEIGMGHDLERGLAIFLCREGRLVVKVGIPVALNDNILIASAIESWGEKIRAIRDGVIGEMKAEEWFNASDFSKSDKIMELIHKLYSAGILQVRSFKLPSDTGWRCGVCGVNPVEGRAGRDVCEECRKKDWPVL